jgi:hypothetical protein
MVHLKLIRPIPHKIQVLLFFIASLYVFSSCLDPKKEAVEQDVTDAGTTTAGTATAGTATAGTATAGTATAGTATAGTQSIAPGISRTSRVKFKGVKRLQNDLIRILKVDQDVLCKELGLYSCTDFVHQITLGGIEPYVKTLFSPNPQTSVTAPLALERVLLAACTQRLIQDYQNPQQAILMRTDEFNGQMQFIDASSATERVLNYLFHEALLRDPNANELSSALSLYEELQAQNEIQMPVVEWTRSMCIATLSSIEFLFY